MYIFHRKPNPLNYNDATKIFVNETKITYYYSFSSKSLVCNLSNCYFKTNFSEATFLDTRLIVSTEDLQYYRLCNRVIGNGNVFVVVTQYTLSIAREGLACFEQAELRRFRGYWSNWKTKGNQSCFS